MHATRESDLSERPQGSRHGEHNNFAAFNQVL
jgi:hypothetical protein